MNKKLTKSNCLDILIGYNFINVGLVPGRNNELYSLIRTRWNNKYTKCDLIKFLESDCPNVLVSDFKAIYSAYIGFCNNDIGDFEDD